MRSTFRTPGGVTLGIEHLAGIGVGGMVAQVAAPDHPDAFSALTLAGTRLVAPGPVDDDLPGHDAATMRRAFALPLPDWSDRVAVAQSAAARAEILGDDPAAARATAERIFDRTPDTRPAVQMADQLAVVFSKLDCGPRWRKRLPELTMPALVMHGRRDPFFPLGNGEAPRPRDQRRTAARARPGRDQDPRRRRRRGRRGDARAVGPLPAPIRSCVEAAPHPGRLVG
jgi:pimeloyl-ACP methyl ester carboxylesterase